MSHLSNIVVAYFVLISAYCHAKAGGLNVLGHIDKEWRPGMLANSGSKVIDSGDKMSLTCTASAPDGIKWLYPSKHASQEEAHEYGDVTITTREGQRGGQAIYYSTLTVSNATYRDTGRYQCMCAALYEYKHSIEHIGDRLVKKLTKYVYVRDEMNLFQQQSVGYMTTMMGTSQQSVTIPCAVTDPNLNVVLLRGYGYNKQRIMEVDGRQVRYSPRHGFTLEDLSFRDTGSYTCQVSSNSTEEEKEFLIYVVPSTQTLNKPLETLESSENVAAGEPFTLTCEAGVRQGQLSSISWWRRDGVYRRYQIASWPEKYTISQTGQTSMCEPGASQCRLREYYIAQGIPLLTTKKVTSQLTVSDSTASDSGSYYCKITSMDQSRESNKIYVNVLSG